MSDSIVIDASALLQVLLKEKGYEKTRAYLQEATLYAPELIRYETANAFLSAHRKAKSAFSQHRLDDILEVINQFPIEMIPMDSWWQKSCELVQTTKLTFYDAAYLGGAVSLGIPLFTFDKEMMDVMKKEKISFIV